VDPLISTPCAHLFHLACLKELVKAQCPLCRGDIRAFLLQHGLTDEELRARSNDEEMRICYEEMRNVEPSEMNPAELATLCMEAVKQHPDEWACVYRDLLLDRVSNAARFFARISHAKHQREPGVFVYSLSVREFIDMAIGQKDAACAWMPLSQLPDTIQQTARGLCNRIQQKTSTDFGVLIPIRNDADTHTSSKHALHAMVAVLSTDPRTVAERTARMQGGGGYVSGVRHSRIAHRDVLVSLLRCHPCRCSGASVGAPNPEYKWAKQYWGRMQRRERGGGRRHRNQVGGAGADSSASSTDNANANANASNHPSPPIRQLTYAEIESSLTELPLRLHTFVDFLNTHVAPKVLANAIDLNPAATMTISNEQGHGCAIKCVKQQSNSRTIISYAFSSDHEHWSPLMSSQQFDNALRGEYGIGGPMTLRIKHAPNQFHLYHFVYRVEQSSQGSGGHMRFFKCSPELARTNNTINARTGKSIGEEPGVTYM
jgi:hypothetical protein